MQSSTPKPVVRAMTDGQGETIAAPTTWIEDGMQYSKMQRAGLFTEYYW
jgi:hypothetical protein